MKSLLTTFVLALSFNAFAVDVNSSWSEIFASNKTDVQLPQVSFLAGEVTSLLSIDQVCYTQDAIKSIKPQYTYAHTHNEAGTIVATGKATLTTGLFFDRYLPAGSGDGSEEGVRLTPIIYPLLSSNGIDGVGISLNVLRF